MEIKRNDVCVLKDPTTVSPWLEVEVLSVNLFGDVRFVNEDKEERVLSRVDFERKYEKKSEKKSS